MNQFRKIPWWLPEVGIYEKENLIKVLESGFLNDGPETAEFEKQCAERLNVRFAVAVTSGTISLFLALKACGVGAGDEVVVPNLTFIATANAVSLTGAKVVLADIDKKSLCLCPESFKASMTSRTKAVVPVYVSGRAGTIEQICNTARKHNIKIVEDAAEAFASSHMGNYLGTIGDVGCFSFSPHKTIMTGQGGLLVTNDETIYTQVKSLKDQGRPERGTGGNDVHEFVGYNFKFTDLQAAVGLAQLNYLDQRVSKQKQIRQWYQEHLSGIPDITLLDFRLSSGEVPQWTDAESEKREELITHLQNHNIHCRRFWHPLHTQKPYRQPEQHFPKSIKISNTAFWLPSAYQLQEDDIVRVSHVTRKFFRNE